MVRKVRLRYHKIVEEVWNLYGPWLQLMLYIGLPLLLLGTPAMFFFTGTAGSPLIS